jgi:hypothetical protein
MVIIAIIVLSLGLVTSAFLFRTQTVQGSAGPQPEAETSGKWTSFAAGLGYHTLSAGLFKISYHPARQIVICSKLGICRRKTGNHRQKSKNLLKPDINDFFFPGIGLAQKLQVQGLLDGKTISER